MSEQGSPAHSDCTRNVSEWSAVHDPKDGDRGQVFFHSRIALWENTARCDPPLFLLFGVRIPPCAILILSSYLRGGYGDARVRPERRSKCRNAGRPPVGGRSLTPVLRGATEGCSAFVLIHPEAFRHSLDGLAPSLCPANIRNSSLLRTLFFRRHVRETADNPATAELVLRANCPRMLRISAFDIRVDSEDKDRWLWLGVAYAGFSALCRLHLILPPRKKQTENRRFPRDLRSCDHERPPTVRCSTVAPSMSILNGLQCSKPNMTLSSAKRKGFAQDLRAAVKLPHPGLTPFLRRRNAIGSISSSVRHFDAVKQKISSFVEIGSEHP